MVTGPTTGLIQTVVKEIRFDLKPVEEGLKGELVSVPVEVKLRRNDKLYKIVDANLVKQRQ